MITLTGFFDISRINKTEYQSHVKFYTRQIFFFAFSNILMSIFILLYTRRYIQLNE